MLTGIDKKNFGEIFESENPYFGVFWVKIPTFGPKIPKKSLNDMLFNSEPNFNFLEKSQSKIHNFDAMLHIVRK